jgi:DNA-entry nuclease
MAKRKKKRSAFSTLRNIAIAVLVIVALAFSANEFLNKESDIISLEEIPEYSGEISIKINGGEPFFENESREETYEAYSPLDSYGRCGTALACLGRATMPAESEERGSISSVTPSGWQSVKYDIVSGKYLYNRSHLIGWQLSAENDNEKNLITGTRSFNVLGMLPYENMVADYIDETGDTVLYRVTPIYNGNELVCRGVLIEAQSVGDNGKSLEFCVFVYNVEPGIVINYLDGTSRLE